MIGFCLFAGIDGAGLGMSAAGFEDGGGIEYDDKIAAVARANGREVTTANILTAKPDDYVNMDWLHASPPCPNFSNAKKDGKETPNDIALAEATAQWIPAKRPLFFTLENVYRYRNSQSWRIIARTLHAQGYAFKYWHTNFSNYGVPQPRKRMIVIAQRDGKRPSLPPATHAENPVNGLFGAALRRWVGWYEAIEDLIPDLPDSHFAEWQIKKLPKELKTLACGFLVGDQYSHNGAQVMIRGERGLAPVVTTRHSGKCRAFIPHTQANSGTLGKYGDEPVTTITAEKQPNTAYINGRIVQMSPRCMARWQTFPDWYKLPDSKTLACRGIGNAVPPLFQQRLGEHLVATNTKE